jgi:hypothetical protein
MHGNYCSSGNQLQQYLSLRIRPGINTPDKRVAYSAIISLMIISISSALGLLK